MSGPILDIIQWHEGMLLMPQHFQQADRRTRQLFWYHLSHLSPYYYGVLKFEIDPALFAKGILHVVELEVIMQDGFVIYFHTEPNRILELDLSTIPEEAWGHDQVLVNLATLQYKEGDANCDTPLARFESFDGDLVPDENTGLDPISFPRLRAKLFFLFGETVSPEFIYVPVVKIQRKNGTYSLMDFIPPQVTVKRSSALGELCLHLIQHIREKISFLTDKVKNPTFASPDDSFEGALKTLISTLIPFEASLYSEHNFPFDLYMNVCQIAGQLSALNPTMDLPTFSPYNHLNLRATYDQVLDYAHGLLDRIQENYRVAEFTLEERVFSINLPQPWKESSILIGIQIHKSFSEQDATDWMKNSIIGSENFLRSIRDKRVLGAPRSFPSQVSSFKNSLGKGILMAEIQLSPDYIDPLRPLIITNISDTFEKRPESIFLYVEN